MESAAACLCGWGGGREEGLQGWEAQDPIWELALLCPVLGKCLPKFSSSLPLKKQHVFCLFESFH